MKMIKSTLAIACLTALVSTSTLGQEVGVLQGVLTDKSQTSYFAGADIQIKELGASAVSRRDGSFRFNNLPEGNYTLVVQYLGAPTVELPIQISAGQTLQQAVVLAAANASLENIIVYGQRAGKASALNQKRMSDSIKSIVSAGLLANSRTKMLPKRYNVYLGYLLKEIKVKDALLVFVVSILT